MSDRLKALVATSTFPRWEGDATPARFVYDLSKELAKDFDVTVAAPHDPGAALSETLEGLKVRRYQYFWPQSKEFLANGTGILPNIRSGFMGKIQAPTLMAANAAFLRKLIAKEKFDVVHSHWLVPSGLNAAIAGAGKSVPHVVTIHSSDLHLLRQVPGGKQMVRYVLSRTDSLFVVSSFLHRMLQDLLGEEIEATVLPMGVFTDQFAPADPKPKRPEKWQGKRMILYVGKLIHVKGVSYLLKAFAKVKQTQPDTALVLVGGGDLDETLKAEARKLQLEDVHFLGPQPHSEVVSLLRQAEFSVVSSIVTETGETEGLPVVILEAMASGRPVVACDVGSLGDVVQDGQNGFLVQQQNPDSLAEGMIKALQSKNWEQLAVNAMETVHRFDWSQIAKRYAQVYRELGRR